MLGLMLPKGTAQYALMPQVMSRLNNLIAGGFYHLPFLLAVLYRNFRLLPENHPYLQGKNIGRYGVRHVIAQSASNLKFSLRHIDQLVLFFVILFGMVLIFLQFFAIGAYFFISGAMAYPTNWAEFFTFGDDALGQLRRSQDVANIMLDLVFGVPHPIAGSLSGFFGSCAGTPTPCADFQAIPTAIRDIDNSTFILPGTGDETVFAATSSGTRFPLAHHVGLHRMFGIYSTGLLVIAVGMMMYFVATILAETAQTGTPFGRRYNKTWVPIRIIVAFGLLMPLGSGLNSSQYIVLYAAKIGTAFATNGWNHFNSVLSSSITSATVSNMVSQPSIPDLGGFMQFMFVSKVCKVAYNALAYDHDNDETTPDIGYDIQAYFHVQSTSASPSPVEVMTVGTTYETMIGRVNPSSTEVVNDVVVISFGQLNPVKFPKERDNVKPLCGQMRWSLADTRPPDMANPSGATIIQYNYYLLLQQMWHSEGAFYDQIMLSTFPNESTTANRRDINFVARYAPEILRPTSVPTHTDEQAEIGQVYKNTTENNARNLVILPMYQGGVAAQIAATTLSSWTGPTNPLYYKGWAAAGIWYNNIAEINGKMTVAAFSLPAPVKFPSVMEDVWKFKLGFAKEIAPKDRYIPQGPKVDDISKYLEGKNARALAELFARAFTTYDLSGMATTHAKPTGSIIIDAITVLLGTSGLYDMRNNVDTHPLAQLVGVGRALVETAVRNLGYATVATMTSITFGDLLGGLPGQFGTTVAGILVTFAMLALTVGFVLFYIVPFLPFIYFFFAVGGWIKGIFEALVGAPLWALAHIRIDAHGLPGNAALNGYFLIFEVMIRPILIVFGLLASLSIFSALVAVLNSVFPAATSNLAGYDIDTEMLAPLTGDPQTIEHMRGRIDQFFFTVIYAVIVYMMGMSSFKLIDTIPNNILRWMGASVATFNDQREDPAQGLTSKASMGSQQVMSRLGGGLQGFVSLGSK